MIKRKLNTHNFLPKERRVFTIDVTNVPQTHIDAYIRTIQERFSTRSVNYDYPRISDIPRNTTLNPFVDIFETPIQRLERRERERRLNYRGRLW